MQVLGCRPHPGLPAESGPSASPEQKDFTPKAMPRVTKSPSHSNFAFQKLLRGALHHTREEAKRGGAGTPTTEATALRKTLGRRRVL